MMPVQFCNYNLDYQQRLGFLKFVVWVGEGVRGGKEELSRRIAATYAASARVSKQPKNADAPRMIRAERKGQAWFDPDALLQRDEVPSWQPGFSFQRLDRLILWAEMLGLVTSSGRLAEWSKPLLLDPDVESSGNAARNPFVLSLRDRAFFLALLLYHDHVLLHLITVLSECEPGTTIDVRRACIDTTRALANTLDKAWGSNINAARARQALRHVLERIANTEKLKPSQLINRDERAASFEAMASQSVRNHLAEYHAVCRFEQLTDLGLFVKDNPRKPPMTREERYESRTKWVWYSTEALNSIGRLILDCDVEEFLLHRWAKACSIVAGNGLRMLNAKVDTEQIAGFLDDALPRARRQVGAIQVHTWVFFAALDAIRRGMAFEVSAAHALLDAMRHDPRYSGYIRQSGQQTYLGRTATVLKGTMSEHVRQYPIVFQEQHGHRKEA